MADDIAIKVDKVNKTFKLPHEKQSSVKGLFVDMFRSKRTYEKQHVLKDISFEIKKGEFFGIVGRNGSGKSTLLKLLAGIYSPDSGGIEINGKLTPFIELGVGFNPELTGQENVFLNGALLGFNRKEMESMYDEIVEFAELERFMDQKLKNYSSGMQVRLAFSIAIRANTEILLLDEVLAVGDSNFQRKCFEYFRVLKKEKKTVVLVTHGMSNVTDFCDRALLIDKGDIKHQGAPSDIVNMYELLNMEATKPNRKRNKKEEPAEERVSIKNVKLSKGRESVFTRNDIIDLSFDLIVKEYTSIVIGMAVHKDDGSFATYYNTEEQLGVMKCKTAESPYRVKLHIDPGQFGRGSYRVDLAAYNEKKPREYLTRVVGATSFAMASYSDSRGGVLNVKANWNVQGTKK